MITAPDPTSKRSGPSAVRQLAPHVYAYTQASGPGIDNASLKRAGVIVGDDLLPVFQLDQPRADRAEHHAPLRRVQRLADS